MSVAEKDARTSSENSSLQRKKAAFFKRKGAENMLQLEQLQLLRDVGTPSYGNWSSGNGSNWIGSSGNTSKADEDEQHEPQISEIISPTKVWSEFLEWGM
jgi:hypothetical protein